MFQFLCLLHFFCVNVNNCTRKIDPWCMLKRKQPAVFFKHDSKFVYDLNLLQMIFIFTLLSNLMIH